MSDREQDLGGRLPLLEPSKLNSKQRELYDNISSGIGTSPGAAGFKIKDDRGQLIGPFNATLYSPEICGSFLALQKLEEEQTSLTKRTRQVVILTVGSVWKAPYELYAHSAIAANAGFTAKQIASLAAGRSPEGLRVEELAGQRFTHQLVSEHAIDDDIYAAAQGVFGDEGLVEMLVLIGCYLSVCALLNAFAVPVPKERPTIHEGDAQ